MGKIVVAYDESEAAGRALDRAADLSRRYDDTLVIVSVVPVWIAGDPNPAPGPELAAAGERAAAGGIEIELVEAIGDPGQAIVEVAERHDAQLIVVGTREPSLVERLLGMSVSEQVQRQARCDVLIVH
jgi:nucleotide-binding universal stress UspA family protein